MSNESLNIFKNWKGNRKGIMNSRIKDLLCGEKKYLNKNFINNYTLPIINHCY